MSLKYRQEQTQLISEVEQLEAELIECQHVEKDLTGRINQVKECLIIDSLTRAIVVELIDRIEVSEVYDVYGEKNLDITINYRFGLPGNNPTPGQKNRAC